MKEGYGEITRGTGGWYDDDRWVSAGVPKVCQHWGCQEWDGDTPTAPLLRVHRRASPAEPGEVAVRKCPRCGREYGIVTPRRIENGRAIYDD